MAQCRLYRDGNREFYLATLRQLVRSRQFRAGFRDYVGGAPFRKFSDDWDYDRGRLLACWLMATGQQLPALTDVGRVASLYRAAEDAGAIL
jgi:hypothetical protein